MGDKIQNEAVLVKFSIALYNICSERKNKDKFKMELGDLFKQFFLTKKICFSEAFLFLKLYCSSFEFVPEGIRGYFKNSEDATRRFCKESSRLINILDELTYWSIKESKGKRYITTEEVGGILSANHQMVLSLIHSDRLPSYKLNNQYRVLYDDVISFMEENKYTSKKKQNDSRRTPDKPMEIAASKKDTPIASIVVKNEPQEESVEDSVSTTNNTQINSDIIASSGDSQKESGMGVPIATMMTSNKQKLSIDL